jgi:phytoene desaturase
LFSQSAYFRFKNQDPTVKNLFFVGAGVHPGAGLPGVVSSAKVTDTLIKDYLNSMQT